ncbi:MAG: UDP-N-acetyl glucosamine 2-epimerase [Chitinophagaceae bacterium]
MKDILHIVGNRPQFIKLAVLYGELKNPGAVSQKIIHTGQHSSMEMSGIFFSQLNIPEPDITLQPVNTGHPDAFIAEVTIALQECFSLQKDCVAFVYGDTNTTLAAAIAARRTNISLFHFEAGVRTGDNSMPEEINRVLTDRLADTNYCCTAQNYQTMLAEGYGSVISSRAVQTGDLMYDAFLKVPFSEKTSVPEKNYVVCTIHRAANILSKEKLSAIVEALNAIHKEISVVVPLHPHTQKRIAEYALQPAFTILPAIGYPEMKTLLSGASYVITDSGGAAREAFFCGKKSVVVMDKPFWPEIIEASCSMSSMAETSQILKTFNQLPALTSNFQSPIFGSGNAAQLIAKDLLSQ